MTSETYDRIHKEQPIPNILIFSVLIFCINFITFAVGSPVEQESFIRIFCGGVFIFLVPGLIWHDILGFRSRHVLETIALSFALTLTIEIVLLPIPFLFHFPIKIWIWFIFIISTIGLLIRFYQIRHKLLAFFKYPSSFSRIPFQWIINLVVLAILILIAYGTYRWGEELRDIHGEKLLQMVFVRYYASLPMVLHDLAISPGCPPINLINLWEYLLAGWSAVINIDPLILFYRARCIIPLLGFSGMYLLIKNIFSNQKKSEIIFWSVFIMGLGWLILLSPSNLEWIAKNDFTRGVTACMGTVHHSDTAMDVLLPLWTALVVMVFRKASWRNYLLLAGVTAAGFMWHSREFFQVSLYAGILGIVFLFFPLFRNKTIIKRWITIFSVFCVAAMVFVFIMLPSYSKEALGYDELKIKRTAFYSAFLPENIAGIRNLFNIPFYLVLSSQEEPDRIFTREKIAQLFRLDWNTSLWLILSAFFMPFLVRWGNIRDKLLLLFYSILWVLSLGWNFSMLLLIVFTYSEFHVTTPRVLYLFAYILIADGFYIVSQRVNKGNDNFKKSIFVFSMACLGAGLTFHYWWICGKPHFFAITNVLGAGVVLSGWLVLFPKTPLRFISAIGTMLICYWWWTTNLPAAIKMTGIGDLFIILIALLLYSHVKRKKVLSLIPTRKNVCRTKYKHGFVYALCGIACFFSPILGSEYKKIIPNIFKFTRPPINWFEDDNYLGLSKKAIYFLQTLSPKQNILVNPLGQGLVSLYAPHYTLIFPYGICMSVINATPDIEMVREGKHPLYPQKDFNDVDSAADHHNEICTWLEQKRVDYIFVQRDYYEYLLPYFQEFSDNYTLVFHNPDTMEIIVQYKLN